MCFPGFRCDICPQAHGLRQRRADTYARRSDGALRASRVPTLLSAATMLDAAGSQPSSQELLQFTLRRHDMLMHQSRSASVRVIGTALVIATASMIAAVASAKEDDGRVSTVVSYGDLDLSRSADVGRLYGRLRYASEKVCYVSDDNRNLRMKMLRADCIQGALNRAVERVNEPKLTQLHAAEPRIRMARKET
jgi:UrcA family protein